jgi:hypothetical protein
VTPGDITAIIVTRGDVPLTPILDSLQDVGFAEVIVWNNGTGIVSKYHRSGAAVEVAEGLEDQAVFGRYSAMRYADRDLIYVQDDDCLIPAANLIQVASMYRPEDRIIANMPKSRWPDYPDSCMVGWGAIFHKDLFMVALGRFVAGLNGGVADLSAINDETLALCRSPEFCRECDVVFTVLTPSVKVDLGFEHLPWAEDPNRAMFLKPGRQAERDHMYALARQAREACP